MITSTLTSPENPEGLIDETREDLYDKTILTIDNKAEFTVATEYRLFDDATIIHRSVHVTLKKPAVFAEGAAASFA